MTKEGKILNLLGQPYVLSILTSISESPKRFVDLSDACPNEKTRTGKLKQLEEHDLITTISAKKNERAFIHYRLTDRGTKILKEALKLEKI